MGILDALRRKDNSKQEYGQAYAIHSRKDRTQVEHDRQLGLKQDIIKDEELYNLYNTNVFKYGLVTKTDPSGKKYQDIEIVGVNEAEKNTRSLVSPNYALRFFADKHAKLYGLAAKVDFCILECECPVEEATVTRSVGYDADWMLANANFIDSIQGRKVRSLLVDIQTQRVEVGERKQKGDFM